MTDHAGPDEAGGAEPADMGTPVEQLRDLSLDVGGEFAPRVRRSIERRLLGGDLIELAWTAPFTALLELLRAPFEWFERRPKP